MIPRDACDASQARDKGQSELHVEEPMPYIGQGRLGGGCTYSSKCIQNIKCLGSKVNDL